MWPASHFQNRRETIFSGVFFLPIVELIKMGFEVPILSLKILIRYCSPNALHFKNATLGMPHTTCCGLQLTELRHCWDSSPRWLLKSERLSFSYSQSAVFVARAGPLAGLPPWIWMGALRNDPRLRKNLCAAILVSIHSWGHMGQVVSACSWCIRVLSILQKRRLIN